ncbi:MAG: hypothetical protein HeimC2_13910 [Candidatus Heimdallarchaeota archaeon LC_2]|nr:MAG: hypothetical protein HeimC2_13910 [Candidatus Heimdallarchaeota archaeon LC_2]
MKFLNKLSKKSPEEKILQEIDKLDLNTPSIMFTEKLPNFDADLVFKVIQSQVNKGKFQGKFIGRKGWFLFNAGIKLDEVWLKLNKGAVNLGEISAEWGEFGNKRVFIAIEEFGKSKKLNEPIFTRKNDLLLLNSYIIQKWNDAVNKFDLDEGEINFDKILENMESTYKDMAAEIIQTSLKSKNSELLLGQDNIVRRRTGIDIYIAEHINSHMENNGVDLHYVLIGHKFGMNDEEIAQIVLQLIENKSIENITNYPTDGFIKKR